jgi:hypothetical protein
MGNIDLDPASHSLPQTWIKASQTFTAKDNGLNHQWTGRVWLNPPYSSGLHYWIDKIITTYEQGHVSQAVLLLKPAVGSSWYQRLTADSRAVNRINAFALSMLRAFPKKAPYTATPSFIWGTIFPVLLKCSRPLEISPVLCVWYFNAPLRPVEKRRPQ